MVIDTCKMESRNNTSKKLELERSLNRQPAALNKVPSNSAKQWLCDLAFAQCKVGVLLPTYDTKSLA